MGKSVGLAPNDISGALAYLAAPDHAGEALMARLVELASDRTAGAGPAAILDDGGDEFGMHGGSFDWDELRQVADFAVVHRRMRRAVRTRLLRDRTGPGRARTSTLR